jgi:hypothetical protein
VYFNPRVCKAKPKNKKKPIKIPARAVLESRGRNFLGKKTKRNKLPKKNLIKTNKKGEQSFKDNLTKVKVVPQTKVKLKRYKSALKLLFSNLNFFQRIFFCS